MVAAFSYLNLRKISAGQFGFLRFQEDCNNLTQPAYIKWQSIIDLKMENLSCTESASP